MPHLIQRRGGGPADHERGGSTAGVFGGRCPLSVPRDQCFPPFTCSASDSSITVSPSVDREPPMEVASCDGDAIVQRVAIAIRVNQVGRYDRHGSCRAPWLTIAIPLSGSPARPGQSAFTHPGPQRPRATRILRSARYAGRRSRMEVDPPRPGRRPWARLRLEPTGATSGQTVGQQDVARCALGDRVQVAGVGV